MAGTFDPYHRWLGITVADQPPDHYRLLGIERFESDPDVIDAAADRQMAHLRSYQNGPHAALSQKLLNEVARARVGLLNPTKKAAYDAILRARPKPFELPAEDNQVDPAAVAELDAEVRASAVRRRQKGSAKKPAMSGKTRMLCGAAVTAVVVVGLLTASLWGGKNPAPTAKAAAKPDTTPAAEPAIATLVWPEAERQGAKLVLDGKELGVAPKGELNLPLAPGEHAIEFHATGYKPYKTTLIVAAGGRHSLRPVWQAVEQQAKAEPPAEKPTTVKLPAEIPTDASDAVWLDELTPVSHTVGYGKLGINTSCKGKPLSVFDVRYDRGLGTHAPSEIVFDLGGQYARFEAVCGLDDELKDDKMLYKASCTFEVWADEEKLYNSQKIGLGDPPVEVDVDVTGRKQLRLVVTDAGDGRMADHADWCNARLLRTAAAGPATMLAGTAVPGSSFPKIEPADDKPAGEKPSASRSETKPAGENVAEKNPAPRRLPLPDGEALAKAKTIFGDTYGDEAKAAKTPAAKAALAKKLVSAAALVGDDAAGRYALLVEAERHAHDAADLALCWEVLGELGKAYELDAHARKAKHLELWGKPAKADHAMLASQAVAALDEAVAADAFDAARELLKVARAEALKAKDKDLVQRLGERQREIQEAEKLLAAAEAARQTLKGSPDDPEANLTLGRYLCFAKGQWKEGLPHLAKGADDALRELAARDLAGATKPDEQLALADGWWEAGDKLRAHRAALQRRAYDLYCVAYGTLPAGVARARVEKRLAQGQNLAKRPSQIVNPVDGSVLVLIPAGTFLAGGPKPEAGGGPPFPVFLPDYYIALTKVTNAQYKRFVDATGHKPPDQSSLTKPVWSGNTYDPAAADYPVMCVTWEEANRYCRWAAARLPTELEWEKAARGTDGRMFPWGNQWDERRVPPKSADRGQWPVTVCPEGKSPYGLYNMLADLNDWCFESFDADAYRRYKSGDLKLPPMELKDKASRGWADRECGVLRGTHGYSYNERQWGRSFRVARDAR